MTVASEHFFYYAANLTRCLIRTQTLSPFIPYSTRLTIFLTFREPYQRLMAWVMRKKKIADVKPGDRLIDENGQVTVVQSKTDAKTPVELYEVELSSGDGDRLRVRADGEHVWPLDPSKPGRVPADWAGEAEATTSQLSNWTATGWQPALAPMAASDGSTRSWTVRTCALLPAETAEKTLVQCVSVDSPTHTFLVAGEDDGDVDSDSTTRGATDYDDGAVTIAGEPIDVSDDSGVMLVDRETFDSILGQAAPTHNCGGPLTLDTPLKLADGGVVLMGDVKAGMRLLSADGEPTTVVATSPVMPPRRLFSFRFETDSDEDLPEWTPETLAEAEDSSGYPDTNWRDGLKYR